MALPARTFLGAAGFFAAGLLVAVFAFGFALEAAGLALGLVAVVFAAAGLALETGLEF